MAPARTEDQQIQAIRNLLRLSIDAEVVGPVEQLLNENAVLRKQLEKAMMLNTMAVKTLRNLL